FSSMAQTLVQLNADPRIRGRVIGLYSMAAQGLRAFSGITVGVAGALVGVHLSLAGAAAATFVVTAGLWLSHPRWHRQGG
ncbi:MAG: MFS transporter, partial [Pseudomonadota bacterium]|nr:MFS transporter [Pseudomonadota bacterium]